MEIQPDKQNLDQTFSNTVYYIDFYQREYKWTKEPVQRLLDDVFYQFAETYDQHKALAPSKVHINARYPWYYLNTYVTNTVEGRVFVVDGQQRLTTLTLILLKLLSQAKTFGSKTDRWLESKITGYSGTENLFWMCHVNHLQVLQGLLDGKDPATIDASTGVTAVNMLNNYKVISAELDARLTDVHVFETFVYYFLLRLVLINLSVDSQHVPMVFEVINDRGVRLRPHEILKGKLLGQIDKLELDTGKYNALWEDRIRGVNAFEEDEIDAFFRYWLKAKYSDTRKLGQRFDRDYHREMFKSDLNASLGLDHSPVAVKAFLKGPFRYYTDLYVRIWRATKSEVTGHEAVFYNSLNEQDSQFMLVLSACAVDDPAEVEKIRAVAEGLDRMFTLLQLQGVYDSNAFATRLFVLSAELRECPPEAIAGLFQKHLLAEITERRGVEAKEAFSYALFRNMSVDRLNTRFARYVFARVESLLASGMKVGMKQPLRDLVTLRGWVNGFHIEHILARNEDNRALFGNDQERFDQERNRLGAVLLLKGKDNQSSNNETYEKKLKTYANTLLWNETLRHDTYKSKLDFGAFMDRHKLPFKALDTFGPDEIEERQKLLFEVCKLIWPAPAGSP